MLEFKDVTIDDLKLWQEYSLNEGEISGENTFVNILLWQKAYNNKIAAFNGNLFLKSNEDGEDVFRFPIGGDMQKGLKEIFKYCKGKKPVFWNPLGKNFHRLPRWFFESYQIIPTRDSFDYIYLSEDLANLSGKKYHSKRNHISAFSKKYQWRYESISIENINHILACADEWYELNFDKMDKYMLCEKEGLSLILQNMELLNIKGGAIFVENKAVAFAIGSPINKNVFDIHIEKALPEFSDAYAVINREFAKDLSDYKYLNREDDLGLEGLRRAKLSYKPKIILEKYYCTPKDGAMQIYEEAFGKDKEFENLLFSKCSPHLKSLNQKGEAVSMLFTLPCNIETKESQLNAKYLFAVATDKAHRKKGYMEKLLNEVLNKNDIFILRPSSDYLLKYYKRFGFREILGTDENEAFPKVTPIDEFALLTEKEEPTKAGEFPLMALNLPQEINTLYFPYTMP